MYVCMCMTVGRSLRGKVGHTCMYGCMCVCMYVYDCWLQLESEGGAHMYVWMYVCMYVCMCMTVGRSLRVKVGHTCMYACVCVCIYIYI